MIGNTFPYRSPLIDIHPTIFSRIHLVLANDSTVPHVKLSFAMASDKRVKDENAWFLKESLLSAHPWDVTEMKTADYIRFNMEGMVRRDGTILRFFLRLRDNGAPCPQRAGYITVAEVGNCDYHDTSFPISYQWVDGSFAGLFKNRKLSLGFFLYGDLSQPATIRVYKRM